MTWVLTPFCIILCLMMLFGSTTIHISLISFAIKIQIAQNRFPLDLFSDFVYLTKVWVVDICGTKNSKAQISIFGRSENGFRNAMIWRILINFTQIGPRFL